MKNKWILVIAVCITQLAFAQDKNASLDSAVSRFTAMQRFNGAVLVVKNGNILLEKGYGYQNAAGKILNTHQTIFQIGSITKQFTAAVILKLVEENKLSLSDKLSKFFPGFPKGDSITVHHLLPHTSGITNYTNDAEFMKNEITKPAGREKMMALFKDKPLDFSPGSSWKYSNSGYSMLGYVVEAVTKNSWEAAVRKYIFTPLKMTHSGFDFAGLKNEHRATGYLSLKDTEADVAPVVDSTVSSAAGSIYSSIGDLNLWHRALQQNTVLSAAQQELAYTAYKNKYGYGWGIDSLNGKRRLRHTGGIPGFITVISRIPEDDVCIVLLSNATDESLNDINKALFAILYDQPYELPKQRLAIALDAGKLKEYEGEYELKKGFTVVMTATEKGLVALPTGQTPKNIYPEKEDHFFDQKDDVQVIFTRNDVNQVDGFVLHQAGAKIPAKKIK